MLSCLNLQGRTVTQRMLGVVHSQALQYSKMPDHCLEQCEGKTETGVVEHRDMQAALVFVDKVRRAGWQQDANRVTDAMAEGQG